jgi:hypothetical protein
MSRGSRTSPAFVLALAVMAWAAVTTAQTGRAFRESLEHPAIRYSTAPLSDAVTALNRRLETGATRLASDPDKGYLPAVLDALQVPKESQLAVFSPTSFQAELISAKNPRAIYFSDTVAVGWVRGGAIEVAAQDPELGPIFYELDPGAGDPPRFERSTECLVCHRTWETLAVPGLLVLSTFPPTTKNGYANGGVTDHRSPFERRWAGWYVTGHAGRTRHMGNKLVPTMTDTSPPVALDSLAGQFDLKGYPTPFSDVVALLVFEHQSHMTNLLTYMTWEGRVAASDPEALNGLPDIAREVVDYMLFVDEAPFAGPMQGTSGFAEMFAAKGPRDSRGRSLRQLGLERRLMRYPCSYMIYAPAFDALPRPAKDAVYRRLWQVLSGDETEPTYSRLSRADRQAIVEILRDTKKDLPGYFQPVRK